MSETIEYTGVVDVMFKGGGSAVHRHFAVAKNVEEFAYYAKLAVLSCEPVYGGDSMLCIMPDAAIDAVRVEGIETVAEYKGRQSRYEGFP